MQDETFEQDRDDRDEDDRRKYRDDRLWAFVQQGRDVADMLAENHRLRVDNVRLQKQLDEWMKLAKDGESTRFNLLKTLVFNGMIARPPPGTVLVGELAGEKVPE